MKGRLIMTLLDQDGNPGTIEFPEVEARFPVLNTVNGIMSISGIQGGCMVFNEEDLDNNTPENPS